MKSITTKFTNTKKCKRIQIKIKRIFHGSNTSELYMYKNILPSMQQSYVNFRYIILFIFLYTFALDPGIRGTGPVPSRPPLLEPGFQCIHSICHVCLTQIYLVTEKQYLESEMQSLMPISLILYYFFPLYFYIGSGDSGYRARIQPATPPGTWSPMSA